ncbi:hypothetical protein POM88_025765 [Heracleum sosnowskyi]|uniref:Uncharacterized protein n=1 Tax=Heracleum sosnowskyi TaxID=360622 RepID=A0AAD8MMV3_9APIA|nr:hypothetical protein POM88_025765 [Heracleum sosnowskyi]
MAQRSNEILGGKNPAASSVDLVFLRWISASLIRASVDLGFFRKVFLGLLFQFGGFFEMYLGLLCYVDLVSVFVYARSDDRRVILWDWQCGRIKLVFHTGHNNNVFQAKFMPFSDDISIITCAADGQVRFVVESRLYFISKF